MPFRLHRLIFFIGLVSSLSHTTSQAATLNNGDAVTTSSFNAAGHWSDGLAPSPGKSYTVGVQFLRTPEDASSYTFDGDSLTLTSGGGILYKGSSTNTYTINPLILDNGGLVRSGAGSGQRMILAGTIQATGAGASEIRADQSPYTINSDLSGSGGLVFSGGFATTYNGVSSMTGNITVSGNLIVGSGSTIEFTIGSNGVNNSISGSGSATFDGAFSLDLNAAGTMIGNSWTLASVSDQTFGGTFRINGFSKVGGGIGPGVWERDEDGKYYSFSTSTGILQVVATLTGEPGAGSQLAPYNNDADTLLLFHFDEPASGSITSNIGSLRKNAFSVNLSSGSTTPPVVTNVLGAEGMTGFGNASGFSSGQLIGWDYNNSGIYQGDNGTTLSADALPMKLLNMGSSGTTRWTIEAMVNSTLSTLNANQQIISTDSSAGSRGFQFRINDSGQLQLNLIGAGINTVATIPTTGTHAYVADTWFHAAASYDGTNIRLYWTRVYPGAASSNLINTSSANVGSTFGTVSGPLCIGGENRAANGESFQGRIDEVRISSTARDATEMTPAYLDSDTDGMADWWEILYFDDLSQTESDDFDLDGISNAQEYLAGTNPDSSSPRVTLSNDAVIASDALLMPNGSTYGRAINGISYNIQILLTFEGHQYTAWYDTVGSVQSVWLARRTVDGSSVGAWEKFNTGSEFLNGDENSWDAHNVIALGICPTDGTLHFSWDHHNSTLRYRRSVEGLCTTNKEAWGAGMLNAEQNWLINAGQTESDVTYPIFTSTPTGGLILNRRTGSSGNGDQLLYTYIPLDGGSGGNWTAAKLFLSRNGTYLGDPNRNAYINGLDVDPDGTIHVTWTWRETPSSSNHDICYAFSADGGLTWRNNAGTIIADTSIGQSISLNSPDIIIQPLDLNQLLINQQAQCVDRDGRVHALMIHRRTEPGYQYPNHTTAPYSTLGSAYYHYFRDPATGTWSQRRLPVSNAVGSRPKIGFDAIGNLYAIYLSYPTGTAVEPGRAPGSLVVATASKASDYMDWEVVHVNDTAFNGEPLLDQARLLSDNILSVYIQEHSTTTSAVGTPLHVFDFQVAPPVPNTAPTLAPISNLIVDYGTNSVSIPLTIGDNETASIGLTLTGSAADGSFIPSENIAFTGTGSSRSALITPNFSSGTTEVTLTVSDGSLTSSRTFDLTVLTQSETWRKLHFDMVENTGDAADAADPDHDGIINSLERAFGGDPNESDVSALPTIDASAPMLSITYHKDNSATDLTITVQENTDGLTGEWINATGTSEPLGVDGTIQIIRFTSPAGEATRKFLRIKVTP